MRGRELTNKSTMCYPNFGASKLVAISIFTKKNELYAFSLEFVSLHKLCIQMPPLHTHITNHEIIRSSLHVQVTGGNYHMTTMYENGQLDGTMTSIVKLF